MKVIRDWLAMPPKLHHLINMTVSLKPQTIKRAERDNKPSYKNPDFLKRFLESLGIFRKF